MAACRRSAPASTYRLVNVSVNPFGRFGACETEPEPSAPSRPVDEPHVGDPLSPQITALECRFRHALSWVTLPQRRRPWTWLSLTFLCSADSRRVYDAKGPLLRYVNPTEYSAECDSSCGTDVLATDVAHCGVRPR